MRVALDFGALVSRLTAEVNGLPAAVVAVSMEPAANIADRTGRLMVQCWRIARDSGACADCGAHSGEAYCCPSCAARHRAGAGRTTDHARIGRALSKRIRAASGRGAGLRLSAEDVARLMAGERAGFGARLARVGGKKR